MIGSLPAHVKLVVSCLSDRVADDPAGQPHAELKRRQIPAENFINLDVLPEAEARLLLFDRWLPKAGRKVSDDQRARIEQRLASTACRQPIFLKLLFEEVQLWHSYDPAPVPGESVGESVPALLGQLFDRLSQPTNHGPLLVNRVLGYLSASRHGLAENEILEILFADPEYRAKLNETTEQTRHELPPNAKRIPIALWSRLRFDLAPYLTERAAPGANVLTFYHRQVAEWVEEDFRKSSGQSWQTHQRLATYFSTQDYFLESVEEQQARAKRFPPTPRPANVRKADELPWQRIQAAKLSRKWNDLESLFTSLFFLEAKVEGRLVFDLARDFSDAVRTLPEEGPKCSVLNLLTEALRRDIHFIARHPTTLFQCLWNTAWWHDCPKRTDFFDVPEDYEDPVSHTRATSDIYRILERWREDPLRIKRPWVRALRPAPLPLDSPLKAAFEAHSDNVLALTFLPRHRLVVTGSSDQTVRLWDSLSGAELLCLKGHSGPVLNLDSDFNEQLIASGSKDGTVRIWDVLTGTLIRALSGHAGPVECISFSPDGCFLASGGSDRTLRIWDCETGDQQRIVGFTESLQCLAFSPDGKFILIGDFGGTVRVVDMRHWSVSKPFITSNHPIDAISVHKYRKRAACAAGDRIIVWELDNIPGSKFAEFHLENDRVLSLAWSPDGTRLAVATKRWDNTGAAYVIAISGAGPVTRIETVNADRIAFPSGSVSCVAFSGRDRELLMGAGRACYSWKHSGWQRIPEPFNHSAAIQCIDFCKPDKLIATGADNGDVGLWRIEVPTKPRIVFRNAGHAVHEVRFSPCGELLALACGGSAGSTTLLEIRSRRIVAALKQGGFVLTNRVSTVRFFSDGKRCVSGASDGTVVIWNLDEHIKIAEFGPLRTGAFATAISLDSRLLAAAERGNSPQIHVWNIKTREEVLVLEGHPYSITELAFSHDDRLLISQSMDQNVATPAEIRVWDLNKRACTLRIPGNTDIDAFAAGANGDLLPFRAEGETHFRVRAQTTVAFFDAPLFHLTECGDSQVWAGALGKHLYCLMIEDFDDAEFIHSR